MDRCKKCNKAVPDFILGREGICDNCKSLKSAKPTNSQW